jgi:predicted nucleic acid-binding protein
VSLYLLDGDALIDLLNVFPPTVALTDELVTRGHTLCVCDVSVAELYSGVGGSDRQRAEELTAGCAFLTTSVDDARRAGSWRYEYARQGLTLSTTDVLVAATAFAHEAAVVTGNVRHFPMPELRILPLPR